MWDNLAYIYKKINYGWVDRAMVDSVFQLYISTVFELWKMWLD